MEHFQLVRNTFVGVLPFIPSAISNLVKKRRHIIVLPTVSTFQNYRETSRCRSECVSS